MTVPGTLSQRMESVGGRPSGFDYMRILLSISVISVHSVATTEGPIAARELFDTPFGPPIRAILPMFFALSGFLVAGSLLRCRTLFSFMGLRFIRIYPALAVEVLLSAFLIGLFVTSLPAKEYFTDPLFREYLWNVTGHIHYFLPGVFEDTPVPVVNAQLWTVPFELFCYLVIGFLAILGVARNFPVLAPLAAVVLSLLGLYEQIAENTASTHVKGMYLVVSFLFGITAYLYRNSIPWRTDFFVVSGILSILFLTFEYTHFLAFPFVVYATVWLGLANPRRNILIRSADYSYGAFLYGFVIQQLFSQLFPEYRYWWLDILVCVPAAIAFAAFSWHCVEKPALGLRKLLFSIENRLFPIKEKSRKTREPTYEQKAS